MHPYTPAQRRNEATLKLQLLLLLTPLAAAFESRLLADVADVAIDFGLVVPHANTLEHDKKYVPPPGNYTKGSMILAMFHSLDTPGEYEIYSTNSTGNIPLLMSIDDDDGIDGDNGAGFRGSERTKQNSKYGIHSGMCLYRWTTSDFQTYHGGDCSLWIDSDGLGDVKTVTRDDTSGKYFMIVWGSPAPDVNGGSPYLYTSVDSGKSWQGPSLTTGLDHYNPPGTFIHAKDDINMIYQPGVGLVDMQLFWQKNATIPGGYCDNGGCDKRRVLGSMISPDGSGLSWNYTGQKRIPGADENDPPELQFYRTRPFFVPGTQGTRIFAHTLLYAPSPYINLKYGRQPPEGGGACGDPPYQYYCHGPHMYEEWWTLAKGASAADMSASAWRRPARFTKMAPENAYLFAQPGLVEKGELMKMIWVGSGEMYTLPLHRGVGLYAPANARVKVPPFDLSSATASTKLMLNADAKWGPKLLQGGCDETCAAYVLVELEDEKGNVIEGYNRTNFSPIMDEDGINLVLKWNNSTQLPLGYSSVTAKIWFRAARVYALYMGEAFEPGY